MRINAILTVDKGLNQRSACRRSLRLSASALTPAGDWTAVVIHNIANGGFLLEAPGMAFEKDSMIFIELPEQGAVRASVVWLSEPFFGCRFERGVSTAQIAAALLKAEPGGGGEAGAEATASPKQDRRRRSQLGPELNFSVAVILSLFLWLAIAAAVQFVL